MEAALSPLVTSTQYPTRDPNQCNEARKRNERHQNWRERNKIAIFGDKMILNTENPKDLQPNY